MKLELNYRWDSLFLQRDPQNNMGISCQGDQNQIDHIYFNTKFSNM